MIVNKQFLKNMDFLKKECLEVWRNYNSLLEINCKQLQDSNCAKQRSIHTKKLVKLFSKVHNIFLLSIDIQKVFRLTEGLIYSLPPIFQRVYFKRTEQSTETNSSSEDEESLRRW